MSIKKALKSVISIRDDFNIWAHYYNRASFYLTYPAQFKEIGKYYSESDAVAEQLIALELIGE